MKFNSYWKGGKAVITSLERKLPQPEHERDLKL
jgi:hypothetical protein